VFIDEVELEVRGGDGGRGAVSFRREKFVPRGGPDGGDGGRGGSVYAVGHGGLRTLNHLAGVELVAADGGVDGAGRKRTGAAGENKWIRVPPGTVIEDDGGSVVGEVAAASEEVLLARGGRGGRGNSHFATPTMQVPRYAEDGGPGQQRRLRLTLKLIADVALIGPPNAGKSSVLAALSSAHPRVAPYPFTTLAPQLGIVEYSAAQTYAVIEVPGLLEGAAEGRGLGLDFLRHVERAKALAVVVDVSGESPVRDFETVVAEIENFKKELVSRVVIVIANKTDLPHDEGIAAALGGAAGKAVIATSAVSGAGVEELKVALWEAVKAYDNARP
jgi:GTP-binding protein